MIQDQEDRKHRQIDKALNVLKREDLSSDSSSDVPRNTKSYRDSTNISILNLMTDLVLVSRKICGPHCLTAEQAQKCLDMETLLKERFDGSQADLSLKHLSDA